ncbi:MAG: hypothetical protein CMN65_06035 [Sphingomonadaceae bacterium]|nr:hypothetical protein [Sphingomonadaceae bacterium]
MIFPSVRSDPITEGRRLGKITNAVMKMTEVSERTEAALRISASSLVRPDSARAKVRRLVIATEKSAAKLTSISWRLARRKIAADLEHLGNRAIACAHLSYFLASHLKGSYEIGSAESE